MTLMRTFWHALRSTVVVVVVVVVVFFLSTV